MAQFGHSHILYDVSLLENPQPALFERESGTEASQPDDRPAGIGRAPVRFFRLGSHKLVCRHYYRGGLVARLVRDWYCARTPENTRAFREWCLLHTLTGLGLPVPVPVAAHVKRLGWFYQADLLTVQIEPAETLADCLSGQALDSAVWRRLGRCIRRFHDHHVCHADLNARNILLDGDGAVHLIDFDRGAIRPRGRWWKRHNLRRLHRSLCKFRRQRPDFAFSDRDWQALLAGYAQP